MAGDLTASVRKEIVRLEREITRRGSELASLKKELKQDQKVYKLLGGPVRRVGRRRGRARRTTPVNWNSVLDQLPSRFTISDIAKRNEAKRKSPVYLRQIAVKWVKQRKTKRIGRGRYQKVGRRER